MLKFRTMTADADQRLKEFIDLDSLATGLKLNASSGDPDRQNPPELGPGRSAAISQRRMGQHESGGASAGSRRNWWRNPNPWQRRRLKPNPASTGYQQVMSRGVLS